MRELDERVVDAARTSSATRDHEIRVRASRARRRARGGHAGRGRPRHGGVRPRRTSPRPASRRSACRSTRSSPRSRAWKTPASSSAPGAPAGGGRGARRGRGRRSRSRGDGRGRRAAQRPPSPTDDRRRSTPEDVIADLKKKIERLGPGEHDGDRAVRRARVAPHVPDHAAQGPARLDRADRRSDPQDRQDHARAVRRGVSTRSTRTSRRRSRRSSAAGARARADRSGERPRERHRHHRAAAGQAAAERAAALGRRKGADGDGADVRHLQVPPEPVLPARRDRRAARRREHRPLRRDAAGHAGRTRSSS